MSNQSAEELIALARFRVLDARNGSEQAKDRLLGLLANEIERIDADAACEKAEKESLRHRLERIEMLASHDVTGCRTCTAVLEEIAFCRSQDSSSVPSVAGEGQTEPSPPPPAIEGSGPAAVGADLDLQTRLHRYGLAEWIRRADHDEMVRISEDCVRALDVIQDQAGEIERMRAERKLLVKALEPYVHWDCDHTKGCTVDKTPPIDPYTPKPGRTGHPTAFEQAKNLEWSDDSCADVSGDACKN